MLHVDEGNLHALLDGAFDEAEAQALHQHISACPECSAQLEEARALRTRSAAILSAAQPARVGMPPFESVLAQSHKQAPLRRRAWLAPQHLAQAAVLVLALGIGWFSRELTMPMRELNDHAAAPTAAPVPAPVTDAPAPPAASEPLDRLSVDKARNESAALRASATADDRRASALGKVVENKDAERDEARKTVATAAEANQVAGQAQQRLMQAPPAQQQAQAQSQNAGAREAQVSAARVQAPRAAAPNAFADAAAPPRWQYMSLQSAEQLTGRRVLRVPELEIISLGVFSTPAGFIVLVNQKLDDSAILELQQRPEPAQRERADSETRTVKEEGAADAARSNEVSLQRAGLTVTARGFVSADSLRALLQRVR